MQSPPSPNEYVGSDEGMSITDTDPIRTAPTKSFDYEKMMHTIPRMLFALSLLLTLTACVAPPYDKFYTNLVTPEAELFLLPWSGRTDYVSTTSAELTEAVRHMNEKGYHMLGYASFEAGAGDYSSSLKAKAAEVQADVVLMLSEHTGILNTVIPVLNYTPGQNSTSYPSGTVNASARNNYGSTTYRTANYAGTSTTTSPGTLRTNYVPVQVPRMKNEASFWRKRTLSSERRMLRFPQT